MAVAVAVDVVVVVAVVAEAACSLQFQAFAMLRVFVKSIFACCLSELISSV